MVESIIKVVRRTRAYGEKHTNAAECCQSYVVGIRDGKSFRGGEGKRSSNLSQNTS